MDLEPPAADQGLSTRMELTFTPTDDLVVIVRHGARHDYADPPAWKAHAAACGFEYKDPPLSRVGRVQAARVGTHLTTGDGKLAAALRQRAAAGALSLLVSPYLRTLQTARPTSDALGVPMSVEGAVCEGPHRFPTMVPRHDGDREAWRAAHSLESAESIDHCYVPALSFGNLPPEAGAGDEGEEGRRRSRVVPTEATFADNLRRLLIGRAALEELHFPAAALSVEGGAPPPPPRAARAIVCFTHAATCVGLAAAFTGRSIHGVARAAPAGIWVLTRPVQSSSGAAGTLRVPWVAAVESSIAHLGDAFEAETQPWTFPPRFAEVHRALVADTAAELGHDPVLLVEEAERVT